MTFRYTSNDILVQARAAGLTVELLDAKGEILSNKIFEKWPLRTIFPRRCLHNRVVGRRLASKDRGVI